MVSSKWGEEIRLCTAKPKPFAAETLQLQLQCEHVVRNKTAAFSQYDQPLTPSEYKMQQILQMFGRYRLYSSTVLWALYFLHKLLGQKKNVWFSYSHPSIQTDKQ
ncbi:hypothetical protein XENOCAPTIV_005988 [Xenoophorus captivus]|uniref:Uncharacterized protein n=1 Tax=Xenoophorus captivus TaxID=1517983 RepID=A0ABV0RBW6_9TELE